MKALLRAAIVALLAMCSASCSDDYDEPYVYDPYYTFADKTWSRIEETEGRCYFVCYEFYRDGTFNYWYYEDDANTPKILYCVSNGRWDVDSCSQNEVTIWENGGCHTYNISSFLDGLSSSNFRSEIEEHKRLVDEMYYHS